MKKHTMNLSFSILTFFFMILFTSCNKDSNSDQNAGNLTSNTTTSAAFGKKNPEIAVSIPPLKWITEKIAGDGFTVISIVAPNASPELFDPKISEIEKLENSDLYFSFDKFTFEHKLEDSVKDKSKISYVLDNQKIHLLENEEHENGSDDNHDHGDDDPHVWFSLENIPYIAENIKNTLIEKYPDKKEIFQKNYELFLAETEEFKAEQKKAIAEKKIKIFIIYHPALSYFAAENGLTQISVEQNGKEPTAKYLMSVIETAKKENVSLILLNPQFPKDSISILSKELPGVKISEFNPMEENVFENLNNFVKTLE